MNENTVWNKLKETLSKPTYLSGEIQRQAHAIEDKTSDNALNKSIRKLERQF